MPAISVVLLNWNGMHLLPGCLESLRAQTFRDFEIIMADNGSTDGSLELVAQRYPEVRVIRFPTNIGFCLAVNEGIRASRGEFIALLNNDTELDPLFLAEMVAAMRADRRIGICAAKMVYHDDPRLINSAGHACRRDGVVADIGRLEWDADWFNRPREVLGACAGASLYRRQMLDDIGLLDPDFFISYEDADLDWRAQWAGWRARYVPTALVRHREGVSRQIRSRRQVFLGVRNTIHVWTKDWPLALLLRRIGAMWRWWRVGGVALTQRGHGDLVARIVWGVLVQTPRMLTRRRAIMRSRSVGRDRFGELLAVGERHTSRPPRD